MGQSLDHRSGRDGGAPIRLVFKLKYSPGEVRGRSRRQRTLSPPRAVDELGYQLLISQRSSRRSAWIQNLPTQHTTAHASNPHGAADCLVNTPICAMQETRAARELE